MVLQMLSLGERHGFSGTLQFRHRGRKSPALTGLACPIASQIWIDACLIAKVILTGAYTTTRSAGKDLTFAKLHRVDVRGYTLPAGGLSRTEALTTPNLRTLLPPAMYDQSPNPEFSTRLPITYASGAPKMTLWHLADP